MKINFLNALNPKSKMNEFQDLDHIDGVSITTVCANLYNARSPPRICVDARGSEIV